MHVQSLTQLAATTELAILMCVFEFLSLVVTVWYSFRELRVGNSWTLDKTQLLFVLFRQGLSMASALAVCLTLLMSRFIGVSYFCLVSVFTISASVLQFVSGLYIEGSMSLTISIRKHRSVSVVVSLGQCLMIACLQSGSFLQRLPNAFTLP